jgi:hypothetical protein
MHAALKPLIESGWLEVAPTSREEIVGLLGIVERRLDEVRGSLKYPDTIFGLAYDAIRGAATVVVRAHGVRVRRERFHERTFAVLRQLELPGLSDHARYYDDCRRKRNAMEYDSAGDVSGAEARDLVAEATRLADAVRAWLREAYPELL